MSEYKNCSKCKIEKLLTDFGKLKSSKDGYRYECNTCRKQYRIENKEYLKKKHHSYYIENKETLNEKHRERWNLNKDVYNLQRIEYRQRAEVKEHIKKKNIEYLPIKKQKIKEKRKNDINFRISEIIRSKIHKMFSGQKTSYQNIIGCDLDWLKKWIEYKFDENMSWDNLGIYWQIDHILPINMFNFTIETNKNICFHWTNLQPLSAVENRQKSDKLILHYYFNNLVSVIRFNDKYKKFLGYQNIRESLCWLREKLRNGKNPTDNVISKNIITEMGNPQPSS